MFSRIYLIGGVVLAMAIFSAGAASGTLLAKRSWAAEKAQLQLDIAARDRTIAEDAEFNAKRINEINSAMVRFRNENIRLSNQIQTLRRQHNENLQSALDELERDGTPELEQKLSPNRSMRLCLNQARAQQISNGEELCGMLL